MREGLRLVYWRRNWPRRFLKIDYRQALIARMPLLQEKFSCSRE